MKIKKITKLLFIIIIAFLYTNISNWADVDKNQDSWYIQKLIPFPKLNDETNKINYIYTRFCNNWLENNKLTENLSMIVRPWQEKEICMVYFNRDKEDIYLWWAFPDNAIESNWNRNCSTNYWWDNPFSKFIEPFWEKVIKVPAKSYLIKKTTIKFPIWTTWTQKWCFAYWVDWWIIESWQTFSLVVRRVAYINIYVQWEKYTIIEKIRDTIIENKNIIISLLFIIILVLLILEIRKYKN